MNAIETDRLAIRNFTPDDWQDLREMILQYEASEFSAYDHQWPTSEEELQGVAEWFSGGDRFLAVCLKPTGKLIGLASLNPGEGTEEHALSLGFIFNFDHHGQGYATEACQAIIDRAFGELGAQRIAASTAAANLPACRLLERLGLKRTGESTGSLRNAADGTPIEFTGFTYALAREEWEKGR